MNRLIAGCVLLMSAAIAASGALHAQARAPASKAPQIDRTEKQELGPCRVIDSSRDSFCFANVRSRAVVVAWEKGLDEHGVPLDAGARARQVTAMENWLRRLAGTFSIEGNYRNSGGTSQVRGTAKCSGVGSGPAMSCVITATWKAHKESRKNPDFDKVLYDAFQPLVVFFGIDPDASRIRATLMDDHASKTRGFLVDDEVAFGGRHPTLTALAHYSWLSSLVAIKPGGDVNMKFALVPTDLDYMLGVTGMARHQVVANGWNELDLQLHREPRVDADNPRESP